MHLSLRTKLVMAFLVVGGFSLLPALRQIFVSKHAERQFYSLTRDERVQIEELTLAGRHLTSLVTVVSRSQGGSEESARAAGFALRSSLSVLETLDASLTDLPAYKQFKADLQTIDVANGAASNGSHPGIVTLDITERMSSFLQERASNALRSYDENVMAVGAEIQNLVWQQHRWTLLVAILSVIMSWNLATHILRPLRSVLDEYESDGGNPKETSLMATVDELTTLGVRQKMLVKELNETRHRSGAAKQALDSMEDAVILVDHNGFIELANGASSRLFEIPNQDLELTPLASHSCLRSIHALILRSTSGSRHAIEKFDFERKDGRFTSLSIIVSAVSGKDSAIDGFVVVARDETETHALERTVTLQRQQLEHAEKLAAVGTMGAIIAHKFSQPLTSVRMFLQQATRALEAVDCPPMVHENLRESLDQLARTSEWVKLILSRARDSATDCSGVVNLRDAAECARDALREKLRVIGGEILIDDSLRLNAFTAGNQRQIEEVFFSLFNNAIQACPPEIKLRASISVSIEDDFTVVSVADNCGGISPEHIDRIFECFFSTKEGNQGTGLGLAIVRQIVSSLGGEVTVSSEIGSGTVFRLRLPKSRVANFQETLHER